jgi:cytochrome oxidase assembly protein ShyY1
VRDYRFLLTRRWIGLLLACVVVAFACYELGRWQFHRYDERHDRNQTTRSNEQEPVAPIDSVMSTEAAADDSDEWRRVEATGRYDVDHQLVVSYRTREGSPGVDVLTPLVTSSGAAVLVDRGWIQTPGNGNTEVDAPDPPSGTVTVTGWVRKDSGDSGSRVEPSDGAVRSISSAAIADTVPYDLYVGFLDLREEQPSTDPSPALADPPDLSGGPSFFYGIQWWFFGLLALGFFVYFAYAERQQPRESRDAAPARPDQPGQSARV